MNLDVSGWAAILPKHARIWVNPKHEVVANGLEDRMLTQDEAEELIRERCGCDQCHENDRLCNAK